VVANTGIYSITVVGYAPDKAKVESTFILTIVAYNAACGPSCSMASIGGRSRSHRIGTVATVFDIYPSLLSN
jgi:hypothetical protein